MASRTTRNWILFFVTVFIALVLIWMLLEINKRRYEKVMLYSPKVAYDNSETKSEVWGKHFPNQWETFNQTKKTVFRSKYNGSAMIDMLAEDPRLVILWAGYGFAKDYNQGRGHAFAIEDMENTFRTGGPTKKGDGPMPGTCWTCKSPDVPRYMAAAGGGQQGTAALYKGKWSDKGGEMANPIGCADCHDAKTMQLKITRPALVEGYPKIPENKHKTIEDATHQEMRSLVCAQCHVEYYFNKKGPVEGVPYLTFPWSNGLTAEAMEKYYDDIKFKDWTHKLSKAPMLKAQHPGWEVYKTGIHAERGVSCADCHMPFINSGGEKFTSHQMESPLNNVSNSCQVCHREETQTLVKNVYDRQDKMIENRDKLEILLVKAHIEAKKAWDLGASEKQMKDILTNIRHAQWRWDYVAASHGGSFHSPIELGRTLSSGIIVAQEARIKLAKLLFSFGFEGDVPYPDIHVNPGSSDEDKLAAKLRAQRYIGLDPDKMKASKEKFKNTLLKEWKKERKEKGLVYAE